MIKYEIGQSVKMKKEHPCGCEEFEILRIGMDFKLKCRQCGHVVILPRAKFEKSVKL